MKLFTSALLLVFVGLHFKFVSSPRFDRATAVGVGVASSHRNDTSSLSPPSPRIKCTCENTTTICTPSEELGNLVPWIACIASSALCLVPIIRVRRVRPQDQGDRETYFWWFLILNSSSYIMWTGYTFTCRYIDSIWVSSIIGAMVNSALAWDHYWKLPRAGDLRWYYGPAFVFCVCTLPFFFPYEATGWVSLGFTVLSHFFRIGATDYTRFDRILLSSSLIGTFSGFLWLFHPDLCVSKQYKISSYVISCIRGLETFLWCAPKIAGVLSGFENRSRDN